MMVHRTQASECRSRPRAAGACGAGGERGFTLLELLIVIGIVAALLALALPALRGVHLRSKKTRELSNLRQVGMAWYMYAQSNNDYALPGYLEPDVQKAWEVSYDYPKVLIRNDLIGKQIPREIAAPWTWRLMPYLSDAGRTLRHHLDDDEEMLDIIEHASEIAQQPAFGYNGYYVGGCWTMTGGPNSRPQYRFANATDRRGRRVNVVARSPSNVHASERLIVFCSTTRREAGELARGADDAPGYHLAVPPILGDRPQWQTPGDDISLVESDDDITLGTGDTYTVQALTLAPVPIGRFTGAAAVFYADGHTDSQTPGALADQSLWIMGAEGVGDTPASHFTHTFE